jgi:hypothetical protein
MDYGDCATQTTHKIITAEENRRKLTLKNPSAKVIRKIKVDGCLITDSGKRCDYMFEIDDTETLAIYRVLYLELKGEGVEHGYRQIVATIDRFLVEHQGCNKECHIVASRVPKAGPEVQQLKIEMLRKKQAKLTISTFQAFVTI